MCSPALVAKLCFFQEENWIFITHQALILVVNLACLIEQLVKGLFFDIRMSLMADCKPDLSPLSWFGDKCLRILVNNHVKYYPNL